MVVLRGLFPIATKLGPASYRRWIVERTPIENVQHLRQISDVMHYRSVQIFNEKKAMLESGDDAIKHQIGEGRDIMSILREFLRSNMCMGVPCTPTDRGSVSPSEHARVGE